MTALGVSAAISIVQAVNAFAAKSYLQGISAGLAPDPDYAAQLEATSQLLARAGIYAFLACAVAFLAWLYRATDNLYLGGLRDVMYLPGWAVAGFVIPIVGLYMSYTVLREVFVSGLSGPAMGAGLSLCDNRPGKRGFRGA